TLPTKPTFFLDPVGRVRRSRHPALFLNPTNTAIVLNQPNTHSRPKTRPVALLSLIKKKHPTRLLSGCGFAGFGG
ncbi:hypothetical protein, partial [Enterobacter intestinihominis]